MNRTLAKELRFAHKMRQALNQSVRELPASTREELAQARKAALRVQKVEPARRLESRWALAGGVLSHGREAPSGHFGMALVLVLIVTACIFTLYHFERESRILDIAEIDSAVLIDDLPISVYTDQGFNAYLRRTVFLGGSDTETP